jgi:glycyl-tRNA synthetase beta chain
MVTRNLLVELFVEELPPKALKKLGDAFAAVLGASLKAQGLTDETAVITPFASPRRLAAHVTSVRAQAADRAVSHKLMPVSVGLNAAGEATPALLKKLAGLSADASAVPWLKRQMDGKAEALFFDSTVTGATLAEGLQKALDEAIAKLPIDKRMQYQLADGWTSVNFVRPAHGLVALHGDDVVPVHALGLDAGRSTHGHRFEASIDPIELKDADQYAQQLEAEGAVIASFDARRDEIVRQLQAAGTRQGLAPIDDAALLDEVTALVERPNVLVCQFEREFLDVPPECLILTMKANQKYFPLLDAAGKLTNQFLVVSNLRPADASRVIEGNERVVRPRLADAKFFFDKDRKTKLVDRLEGLKKVVYLNKLGDAGDMYSRMDRVRTIARAIGEELGGPSLAENAYGAATFAKADLLTDMVGEFPELQGVMGGYYARHDGELEVVSEAIEDHYKPRFSGDSLPRTMTGVVVALADKLETLAGLFGIGQVPTGDKDPFALRRHALGVVRLLVERDLPLSQYDLVQLSLSQFPEGLLEKEVEHEGLKISKAVQIDWFLNERAVGYWRDKGFAEGHVNAVLEVSDVPSDHGKRLVAVAAFARLPEAPALASANKRVANILKKSSRKTEARIDDGLLVEAAEKSLAVALHAVKPIADLAFDQGDYTSSLRALASLKTAVDAFFDTVMVNAEDPTLRANRLGLLATLHAAMNRVADLSKLAT